jgi:hypothetical protein
MRKRYTFYAVLMLTVPCSAVLGQQLRDEAGEKLTPVKSDLDPCPQYKSAPLVNEYANCLTAEADKGSVAAANILIDIYNGAYAIPPDQFKATYYASMSAQQNDPIGMRSLALRNAIGLGTTKNWDDALRLRRRQAQLYGALPPLHISGQFTGQGLKDPGVVTVSVHVNPDGTKKSCSAKGSTDRNHNLACKVIMKYFAFLPSVSPEGREVDGEFSTNIIFKPYRKPDKIDANIPARLVSGEITRQDFLSYNQNIPSSALVLNLELSATGAITACNSTSGDVSLTRSACQIAKRKLVFTPSKNVRGQGVASRYDLAVDLSSNNGGGDAPLQAPRPKSIDQESNSGTVLDDKILQNAIKRCELIGFEKGTSDYKICVTDQIKILSGVR